MKIIARVVCVLVPILFSLCAGYVLHTYVLYFGPLLAELWHEGRIIKALFVGILLVSPELLIFCNICFSFAMLKYI